MYHILIFSSGVRYTDVLLKIVTEIWLDMDLVRAITGWVGEVMRVSQRLIVCTLQWFKCTEVLYVFLWIY